MLSKEAIEEYKKLYKDRFQVDISDDEAVIRANNLVNLYKLIFEDTFFDKSKNEDIYDSI